MEYLKVTMNSVFVCPKKTKEKCLKVENDMKAGRIPYQGFANTLLEARAILLQF